MITRETKIEDVLRNFPKAIPVFGQFGIDCAECQLSAYEDIEHGAKVHGIDLERFLEALNRAIRE